MFGGQTFGGIVGHAGLRLEIEDDGGINYLYIHMQFGGVEAYLSPLRNETLLTRSATEVIEDNITDLFVIEQPTPIKIYHLLKTIPSTFHEFTHSCRHWHDLALRLLIGEERAGEYFKAVGMKIGPMRSENEKLLW